MKKVLVIQPLHQAALRLLEEREDVAFEVVTDFSADNLLGRVMDADAITIRDAPLPTEVLEAAPRLKVISRHGVGYDNIPVDYCTSRQLPVTVVGDVNANAVAEQTMCLMLAAARAGIALDYAVRRGDFAARARILGVELRGRRLLILGFGRIGRLVAARALAFGMQVSVFDPYAKGDAAAGVVFVDDLDENLATADVVSLHIPLVDGNRNFLDQRRLMLLPRGAIVINTARGGLVDEDALLAAMACGHIRAAGLDTFAKEPVPANHPMLQERNIVLSPHSAALTEEALLAMGLATVRNVLAGLDGTLDPAFVVNPSTLAGACDAAQ